MTAWIAQIDAYDPVAAAAVSLRASDRNDERVCHLDGQTWWPSIASLPALRYDFFDGGFAGQIAAPTGQCRIATEAFPTIGRMSFGDARFRLWRGNPGDSFAAWTLTFDGRITAQPELGDGSATFALAVDDRWLDKPLLDTYAGTGGAEGPADLAGQAKPLALGTPRFSPAVPIDLIDLVFQLHDGAIEQVEMAFERANRFGAPVADYASLAALLAATIANGAYATCLSAGLVRFGAPPIQPLAFHIKGDKPGASARARLPGALIGRIAAIAGAPSVATASLTALDAARPWPLSIVLTEQTTAREVIQSIAASVNAVAGIGWTGGLWARPVGIGAPSMTLDAGGGALPPVAGVRQLPVAAPFSVLEIESERTWLVHALTDIAFTAPLVPLGVYDAATVYREGNIVKLANGSEWLFIGTAPAAGVTPSAAVPTTWSPYGDAVSVDWSAVVDDGGKPADGATADLTLTVVAGATTGVTGNRVERTAGGAWDAFVVGSEVSLETARVRGKLTSGRVLLGLTDTAANTNPGSTFANLIAAWYREGTSWRAYEPGAGETDFGTARNGVTFGPNTQFEIAIDGLTASYFADGVYMGRSVPIASGKKWRVGATPFGAAVVSDINFSPFADVTALSVPTVTGAATIQIAANSSGVTTTQLAVTKRLLAKLGVTDVSMITDFALGTLPGGITATINNTPGSADRGVLSVTVANSGGVIPVTVTFASGYSITVQFTVVRTVAPPAQTGGSGGSATTVSDSNIASPTSTTHAPASNLMTISSTAGGTLAWSASADYTNIGSGSAVIFMKAVYRLAGSGGGFTDFAAEGQGSGATVNGDGYVSIGGNKTGLALSTLYEVQLFARKGGATQPYVNAGIFTVSQ